MSTRGFAKRQNWSLPALAQSHATSSTPWPKSGRAFIGVHVHIAKLCASGSLECLGTTQGTSLSKSHWDLVEGLWTFLDAFSMKRALQYFAFWAHRHPMCACSYIAAFGTCQTASLNISLNALGKNMTAVDWSQWKGHSEVVNLRPDHWSMQHATFYVISAQDHNYPQAWWSECRPFQYLRYLRYATTISWANTHKVTNTRPIQKPLGTPQRCDTINNSIDGHHDAYPIQVYTAWHD